MDSLGQIMVMVGAIAGSSALWNFLCDRLKAKLEMKKNEAQNDDGNLYRDDLKARVRNLETLLAQSSDEKDELRDTVLALTAQVSELRVKVEFLEKENERLKMK